MHSIFCWKFSLNIQMQNNTCNSITKAKTDPNLGRRDIFLKEDIEETK